MTGFSELIAFMIGASVGSFVNVVADRLPLGHSLLRPASACATCKTPLHLIELVPIASYLWLRGRCRHCSAAIPGRLPVVEAATGLLYLGIFLRYGFGADFLIVGGAIAVLAAITLIDLDHRLILNEMVIFGTVAALVLAPFWTEIGLTRSFLGDETVLASFINSIIAGTGAFLAFLLVFLIFPKGMGAGDVKLAGMLGLLVGYPGVVVALWLAVIVGGAVAALLLTFGRKGRKDVMPFGPFLALGSVVALFL